jgi:hypothetical protein
MLYTFQKENPRTCVLVTSPTTDVNRLCRLQNESKNEIVEKQVIETWAFRRRNIAKMQSGRSTTEPHPLKTSINEDCNIFNYSKYKDIKKTFTQLARSHGSFDGKRSRWAFSVGSGSLFGARLPIPPTRLFRSEGNLPARRIPYSRILICNCVDMHFIT